MSTIQLSLEISNLRPVDHWVLPPGGVHTMQVAKEAFGNFVYDYARRSTPDTFLNSRAASYPDSPLSSSVSRSADSLFQGKMSRNEHGAEALHLFLTVEKHLRDASSCKLAVMWQGKTEQSLGWEMSFTNPTSFDLQPLTEIKCDDSSDISVFGGHGLATDDWVKLIQRSPGLRKFEIYQFGDGELNPVIEALRSCPHLEELKVGVDSGGTQTWTAPPALECWPNLRVLHLERLMGPIGSWFMGGMKRLNRLEDVSIGRYEDPEFLSMSPENLEALLTANPRITSLRLEYQGELETLDPTKIPHLQCLDVRGTEFDADALVSIATSCHDLREMSFGQGDIPISANAFVEIFQRREEKGFPRLTALFYTGRDEMSKEALETDEVEVNDAAVQAAAHYWTELTDLGLVSGANETLLGSPVLVSGENGTFSGNIFEAIATHCKKLGKLNVQIEKISKGQLKTLLEGCPLLTDLTIRFTDSRNEITRQDIVDALPILRSERLKKLEAPLTLKAAELLMQNCPNLEFKQLVSYRPPGAALDDDEKDEALGLDRPALTESSNS